VRIAQSKNAVFIEVKLAVNSLEHPGVIAVRSTGLFAHIFFVAFKRGEHCDVKRRAWIRGIYEKKRKFVTSTAIIAAELDYDHFEACCFVFIRREG